MVRYTHGGAWCAALGVLAAFAAAASPEAGRRLFGEMTGLSGIVLGHLTILTQVSNRTGPPLRISLPFTWSFAHVTPVHTRRTPLPGLATRSRTVCSWCTGVPVRTRRILLLAWPLVP